MSKLSLQIWTRINRAMKNKLPHCNFWIALQTKCRLINFFLFKERIRVFLHSGIVYEFQWGGCNATYYGKTKRHFKDVWTPWIYCFYQKESERGYTAWKVSKYGPEKTPYLNIFHAVITILPWRDIIYFAIIHLVLTIFPHWPATTMTLKLP